MRRRADGLATLSRLKRHEMENVALKMGELNRAIGQIETERQDLLERLNERGDTNAIESTRVLSEFIRNVSESLRRKECEAQRLRDSCADIQVQLNSLFAETKRIDLVAHRRALSRKRRIEQAETAAQNEAFLSIWVEAVDCP